MSSRCSAEFFGAAAGAAELEVAIRGEADKREVEVVAKRGEGAEAESRTAGRGEADRAGVGLVAEDGRVAKLICCLTG